MEEKSLIETLQEIKDILGAISDGLYGIRKILEQTKGGCSCAK